MRQRFLFHAIDAGLEDFLVGGRFHVVLADVFDGAGEEAARAAGGIKEALADPGVRARLTDLGHEIAPPDRQTPEGLGAFHKAELEKWSPIIKAANIRGE